MPDFFEIYNQYIFFRNSKTGYLMRIPRPKRLEGFRNGVYNSDYIIISFSPRYGVLFEHYLKNCNMEPLNQTPWVFRYKSKEYFVFYVKDKEIKLSLKFNDKNKDIYYSNGFFITSDKLKDELTIIKEPYFNNNQKMAIYNKLYEFYNLIVE